MKRYGLLSMIFDFAMTIATGGFWLVWVAVKYLRKNGGM